jgi:hypothetical protein
MIDNIGVIKASEDTADMLKKSLWITSTPTKGFYLVDLKRKFNKKILANHGVIYVLSVWTDYFGGAGEQGSTLIHVTNLYNERERPKRFPSINKGLLALGFDIDSDLQPNTDPFDSIGLGEFRDYEYFVKEIKHRR